jgi:hypothetical protein
MEFERLSGKRRGYNARDSRAEAPPLPTSVLAGRGATHAMPSAKTRAIGFPLEPTVKRVFRFLCKIIS